MSTVAQRQKGSLEIVTIYVSDYFYWFARSKEVGKLGPNYTSPAAFFTIFFNGRV